MSLATALSTALRPRVPANVLSVVTSEADRVVVENILLVLAEYVQIANVPMTTVEARGSVYRARIPLADNGSVTYRQLARAMAYNPARLQEIAVEVRAAGSVLVVHIANETTPLHTSDVEAIHIHKRARAG